MGTSYAIPKQNQDEVARVSEILGLPEVGERVSDTPNPHNPEVGLSAEILECHGDEYHARPELSQSQFSKFLDEPEVFHDKFLHESDPEPEPGYFAFGKQVEHFLFHDELPGNPVVIPVEVMSKRKRRADWFEKHGIEYDENNPDHHTFAKSGKPFKEFEKKHADRELLTPAEYEELVRPLEKIREQIRAHEKAKALLYGPSIRHLAIAFTCPFTGVDLRCQLDILSEQHFIVDYKTAKRNNPGGFAYDFEKFNYHLQAAFYREAVRQLTGGVEMPVIYVTSEKASGSYIVECFSVNEKWFGIAIDKWRRGMIDFEACVDSQVWRRPTHNTIIDLYPPKHLLKG